MQSIESVIENYSFEELQNAKTVIESKMNSLRNVEIKKAREELRAKAAQLGIEPEALLGTGNNGTGTSSIAVKYRDPENNANTWTGRGKQPNWLKAKLQSGSNLDDYLI